MLVLSNGLVSATRRWILDEIRIPIYVLIIASLVTCTELVFKTWVPALGRSLGIFILLMALGAFRELVSMAWLLAVLPPGAFFSLALAIAGKNALDARREQSRGDALARQSRRINR